MSTTTKDIAVRVGCSQQTVSDVLRRGNKSTRYSESIRRRIEAAAEEMGYRVNGAAQAMNSGRFNAVGLLMSRHPHQSTVVGELLRGIHDALEARGIGLALTFVEDAQLESDSLPNLLRRSMVDGLLVNYTHGIPQKMVDLIQHYRLPAVWINSRQERNCVFVDDERGAADVTRRFISDGHRRIAYCDLTAGLETASEVHYSRLDRLRGYQQEMRKAGLTPQVLSPNRPCMHEAAVQFVSNTLSQTERPSAMICYGQQELSAVVNASYATGIRCGQELALAVFGHTEMPFAPPHRMMLLPEYQMGLGAAQVLMKLVEGSDDAAPLAVPMRFSDEPKFQDINKRLNALEKPVRT